MLNGVAAAQPFLNTVRSRVGKPTKPATLQGIMSEKYIQLFQNVEVWNDYKRTCTPNFPPTQVGQKMPGRMYYDPNERFTNTNIPAAGQGFNGSRNPDDPPNTVSDGTGQPCLAG